MGWQVSGRSIELCNCAMLCPCLGPEGKPDQGWCGAALGFDIQRGSSEGIDLGGTKVALTAEWPGNFFAGNGTARLYISNSASAEQRRELEAIFSGQKGGVFEGMWGSRDCQRHLALQLSHCDLPKGRAYGGRHLLSHSVA